MVHQENFRSEILGCRRRIFVHVPPGAETLRGPSLPVLYMQDGQNLFTGTCREVPWQWELDRVAEGLTRRGAMPRILIVGIANGPDRENEYTHVACPWMKAGGRAERYLDFVTEEVMPWVRSRFPVSPLRTATGFGGSSLGGLLALYAAVARPRHFGVFLASSPSIWWGQYSIFAVLRHRHVDPRLVRLWVDVGRREMKGLHHEGKLYRPLLAYRRLDDVLRLCGFRPGVNYRYFEDRLGTHDERSWGRRMARALPFLFGASAVPVAHDLVAVRGGGA